MKYILFAYNGYYPQGGINDMILCATSIKEIIDNIKIGLPYECSRTKSFDVGIVYQHKDGNSPIWYDNVHIVSAETLKMVVSGIDGEYTYYPE